MAIDYDGGSAGVFTHLGKLVKHSDLQLADGVALAADQDEIVDALDAGDQDIAVQGIAPQFDQWRSQYAQRRTFLAQKAIDRLRDRSTVLTQIGAVNDSESEIMTKLIRQMLADGETVDRSTVTLGSVTAGSGNVGNGTILLTKVLDGITSPGQLAGKIYLPQPAYKGLDSELCVPSETMILRCDSDSFQNGDTEGGESWVWEGKIADQPWGILGEGSGPIGTIRGAFGNANLLQNADFETFSTTDTPDSWSIYAGTVTTHIAQDAGNAYHGSSGLKFLGTGAQASIGVSQAISRTQVTANKRYCVTLRMKASATVAAGAFTCQFEGTGYSAGGTESISVAAGSLPTSYTLYSFYVNMPASIPSDFKLVIKWTGTPTNAKNLWVDDVSLSAANYGGGIAVNPIRGSTPFVRGDYFTFTVANSEKIFQRFFRRAFGAMLPSSGSPSIADSLAA